MIVQIRGTSGSGKTWVMRRVMSLLGETGWIPYKLAGRKQPLYYHRDNVVVLGGYEPHAASGGCDNIGSARHVFELIDEHWGVTQPEISEVVILCEGLLLSEDTKWSSQLPDLRCLFLATPLDQCLAQIKTRRAGAGNDKEVNPKNTTNRVWTIERARQKLDVAGVLCRRATATQAPGIILEWINGRHP